MLKKKMDVVVATWSSQVCRVVEHAFDFWIIEFKFLLAFADTKLSGRGDSQNKPLRTPL